MRSLFDGGHSDAEATSVLERLGRELGCPTGYVSDLAFWSPGPRLSPEEVVDRALAYRPTAL